MEYFQKKSQKTAFFLRLLLSVFICGISHNALSLTTQPIQNPSTYKGSLFGESACNTTYNTTGVEPKDISNPNAKYPLFLFFGGTRYSDTTAEREYYKTSTAIQQAVNAMASRGFVAVSVQYDNWHDSLFDNSFTNTGFNNKLACLFGMANPNNLLNTLCARSNVDCSAGIATFGYSQGAFMGVVGAKYDNRINAAFAIGYYPGALTTTLAYNRLRIATGENDLVNVQTMPGTSGTYTQDCPGSTDQCLRNDGSGWIRVLQAQLTAPNAADHCWFFRTQCSATSDTIEPTWWPGTTYSYSLAASANWLAGAAVQTRSCPATVIALKANANNNFVSARLLTTGAPLQATAPIASGWEKFSCMERGNGRIALQATNGLYVSATSANGYQLQADSTEGNAAQFQYINLGSNNIQLKAISNSKFVSADLLLAGQLIANRTSASAWETFTVIPQ